MSNTTPFDPGSPDMPRVAYTADVLALFRDAVTREVNRIEEQARRQSAQLRQMLADVEASTPARLAVEAGPQGRIGRDPYAAAPGWADDTDQRVANIATLHDALDASEGGRR